MGILFADPLFLSTWNTCSSLVAQQLNKLFGKLETANEAACARLNESLSLDPPSTLYIPKVGTMYPKP